MISSAEQQVPCKNERLSPGNDDCLFFGCLFHDLSGVSNGAAIYTTTTINFSVVQCGFKNCYATSSRGAIYASVGASVIVLNSSSFDDCAAPSSYHSFSFISTKSIVAVCNLVTNCRKSKQSAGEYSFRFEGSVGTTVGFVKEMNSTNNHLNSSYSFCAFYSNSFAKIELRMSNLFNDSGSGHAVRFHTCTDATCETTNIASMTMSSECICSADGSTTALKFNDCCFKENVKVALFYPESSSSITLNRCFVRHNSSTSTIANIAINNPLGDESNIQSDNCFDSKAFSIDLHCFDAFVEMFLSFAIE
jgi:hypothetical protein